MRAHQHPADVTKQRATGVALAVSLALHAALLFAAGLALFAHEVPRQLIMLSLLRGGGGGSGSSVAAGGGPPVAPAPAPRVRHASIPPVAPKRQRVAAPAHRATDHARPAPRPVEPAAPAAAASGAPTSSGTGTEQAGGSGSGQGGGIGSGRGQGHGPGNGLGSGGDLRAHCVICPKPDYPRVARARGWQGTVSVEVALSADGTVREAAIDASSGYDALDAAALAVARRSRFQLANLADSRTARGRIAYGFRLTAP